MSRVLAIDLGGTNVRWSWTNSDDDGPDSDGSEPDHGAVQRAAVPPTLDALRALLDSIAATSTGATGAVGAVGVGVPGLVAGDVCTFVPNVAYLEGHDLGGIVEQHLGVRATVANDAHLALLAEATHGAAAGAGDAVLLAIGTGIGSAVLAGGRIVRGSGGAACSFGWACADVADPGDPNHGWLERHAAGPALDAALPDVDGPALVELARAGDPAGRAALEPAMHALGTALAGAVALLAPEVVVVAGGVSGALDVLGAPIRVAMARHLPPHLRHTPLVAGRFGAMATLTGARLAARRGARWWEVVR